MTATEFVVRAAGRSDPGNRRTENQDAYRELAPVFLVADGMGGHAAGREAADLVVRAFAAATWGPWVTPADIDRAMATAEESVRELGQRVSGAPGSTVTGVALARQNGTPAWLVFNVGDSRTYLLRDGSLEQVTVDHSQTQSLVEQGMSPAAARTTAGRNVITRAIGGGLRTRPQPDFWLLPACTGDRVLICSDGLTSELSDALIAASLLTHADAAAAADSLLSAALEGLARDNVTAVVVDAVRVSGGSVPAPVDDTVDSVRPGRLRVAEDTVPRGRDGSGV